MKIKFFLILFLVCFSIQAQIDRIEPPFWWSGMNLTEVQIMFYGKNIAQYEVSVNKDLVLKNVLKTENPNYIFVTLDTENLKPGNYKIDFRKNGKISFSKNYELKERRPNSQW